MRFSEFKKQISDDFPGKVLIDLDDLEIYHPNNNKLLNLVKDKRSYLNRGKWYIYPIAQTESQVYVVCPYCGEIHLHGNSGGDYSGERVPHCTASNPNYFIEKLD